MQINYYSQLYLEHRISLEVNIDIDKHFYYESLQDIYASAFASARWKEVKNMKGIENRRSAPSVLKLYVCQEPYSAWK